MNRQTRRKTVSNNPPKSIHLLCTTPSQRHITRVQTAGQDGARPGHGGEPRLPSAFDGLLSGPVEKGLDETVDVAVEHTVGVADLVAAPEIFDHPIGLEDIGADLVAPGNILLGTLELVELRRASP